MEIGLFTNGRPSLSRQVDELFKDREADASALAVFIYRMQTLYMISYSGTALAIEAVLVSLINFMKSFRR